ncbi:MAG: hypothetical protein HHJ11_03535, partial [Phycicoccus sp.]|nr:hypothetical protein [Phycicoccus sp.]
PSLAGRGQSLVTGFLSENPLLAEACAAAGITFVGPPADVMHLTGNKARAIAAAKAAGLPTLRGSAPSDDVETVLASAEEIGFPIFVKAVAGGGGRGMRRVERREDLKDALLAAMRGGYPCFDPGQRQLDPVVDRVLGQLVVRHVFGTGSRGTLSPEIPSALLPGVASRRAKAVMIK